ncbi:DUF397 domain-containing protein [Streptomyces sp. NPDC021098]|uniref:DUF397 domain-containing protein n=1 Tax=unclassified Streptomyces TaxID=2593676 RepID=UPI0037BDB08E
MAADKGAARTGGDPKMMVSLTFPQDDADWFKSSFSQPTSSTCVEVRFVGDSVRVRNNRFLDVPELTFDHAEWEAFLLGAWNGEFNIPQR